MCIEYSGNSCKNLDSKFIAVLEITMKLYVVNFLGHTVDRLRRLRRRIVDVNFFSR